jgi:hypothetical protein
MSSSTLDTSFSIMKIRMLAIVVILVFAGALRFALADYSLWFDEYASMFFAHQPLERLWSSWMLRETNPPLYYSVLHEWVSLVGPMDRVALRVPSIVASLGTIGAAYYGIARSYGTKAAVAGALMLTMSAQQIAYAHQVRSYSLFTFAITVSFFGLLAIVNPAKRQRQNWVAWTAYVGGATAANYLHITGFLWLPISAISLMVADRRFTPLVGSVWLRLALAQAVILTASAWELYIVLQQIKTPNPNISWLQYLGIAGSAKLYLSSTVLVRDTKGLEKGIILILIALSAWGAIRTWSLRETQLTVVCWVITLGIFFLFSMKQPILIERTVYWMAVFPMTLAAVGLSTVRRPLVYAGLLTLVVALLAFNLTTAYKKFEIENWDAAITQIAKDPKAILVVSGPGHAIAATEACRQALHTKLCPFPNIPLTGQRNNAWAIGSGPQLHVLSHGRVSIGAHTHLYFIQRFGGYPLEELQAAGVFKQLPPNKTFLAGPYDENKVMELEKNTCAVDGLIQSPCPSALQ